LHGNWEEALLFALKAALETYRFNHIFFLLRLTSSCLRGA
jgi:hypothetical protein